MRIPTRNNYICNKGHKMQELNQKTNEEKDYGLVSIVMPTYKQDELLHKAVESVIEQTYKNIELIVIDDNKEEGYRLANEKYFNALNDQRIIYLQNEFNMGSTATRNKGIWAAKGKYITFLDDDDIYFAEKIEKQASLMNEHSAQVSVCNLELCNEEGKIVDKRERRYLNKRKESLLISHLKYHITCTDTMMYDADFLKSIGGFDEENLGDEFYLMYKALEKKPVFAHLDYTGVRAVVHAQTGLSSGDNKIKTEEILIKFKREKFHLLKRKDIRYINMRHNVVLAIAYRKNKARIKCVRSLVLAAMQCPFGMLGIITGKDR